MPLTDQQALILDSYVNSLKGLGSLATSTPRTVYSAGEATIESYAQLYEHNWLARRVVQIFPDDALRARPEIEGVEKAEADRIWTEYDRLNASLVCPQGVVAQGLYQGRALGGAAILLGYKTGQPEDPAPPVGKGTQCYWWDAVPWADLQVVQREDDRNLPGYGQPRLLKVAGEHSRRGEVFHVSRLVPCEGLPRAIPRQSDLTPWLSVLQPVGEALEGYGLAWESVNLLLQEASVGVMKMAGMIRMITSQDSTSIEARQRFLTEGRSVARTIFLDPEFDEEFTRTEVSFAGVPQILEQQQMQVCGAAQIPATRLFGRSPAGENATGESDMRIFYDEVAAYRRRAVQPKQTRLLSEIAGRPVQLKYPPLKAMTEAERATLRFNFAQADEKYFDLGVVTSDEIRASRAADGSLGVDVEAGSAPTAAPTT